MPFCAGAGSAKTFGWRDSGVPITVDAMLPDEPNTSLRKRMRVTREKYCWTCHEKMDPLGLPFEMYNHAGLFRTTELDKPVDTSGEIIDSGDPALDGPVKNALEMIERLSSNERVEQVFVRHAFRFWMGRNETLNDAPVLQAAHKAYQNSGGSMDALLVSLLHFRRFPVPQSRALGKGLSCLGLDILRKKGFDLCFHICKASKCGKDESVSILDLIFFM